jgi:hypothetical protein
VSNSTSKSRAVFERDACRVLRLPYELDLAGTDSPYHRIGNFTIGDSDPALDRAVQRYRDLARELMSIAERHGIPHGQDRDSLVRSYEDLFWAASAADLLTFPEFETALRRDASLPSEPPTNSDKYSKREIDEGWALIRPVWRKAAVYVLAQAHQKKHLPADRAGYRSYLETVARPDFLSLIKRPIPAFLSESDRRRHTYIVGTTRSGKTELMKLLIHETFTKPDCGAIVVIDPHGEFAAQIARWPEHNTSDRLIYIDPYLDEGMTPTLNPFELANSSRQAKQIAAQQILATFEELLAGRTGGELSVNMHAVLMPCLLALLDRPGSTLADLRRFMRAEENSDLVAFARERIENFEAEFVPPHYAVTKNAIAAKLSSLLAFDPFRNLLCGPSTFDLERAVNERRIIVFNLSKGRIGDAASEAIGRFIISTIQAIAMRRDPPKPDDVPLHLFVDECQNFITKSTSTILEEAAKYKVYATLCQQTIGRGMSIDLERVIRNIPQVKFIGRAADPIEQDRGAKLIGIEAAAIRSLGQGEFYTSTSGSPPFKLRAASHLVDWRHAMSLDDWHTLKMNQLARFYRPIGPSRFEPRPDSNGERNLPDATKRRTLN